MMGKTTGRVHLYTNENTDEIEALMDKRTWHGIFFKILYQKNFKWCIEISYLYKHHG